MSNFFDFFFEKKVQKSESKVIIIKTMVLIAENDEIKMEFAQKEGFRKLLHLLLNKEEKVYQVISKALLHFLHLDNSPHLVSKIQNIEETVNFH